MQTQIDHFDKNICKIGPWYVNKGCNQFQFSSKMLFFKKNVLLKVQILNMR